MADLSSVIDQYLADRRAKGAGKGTMRNQKWILGLLLADIGNIQTRNIRPQHVDVFWSRRGSWSAGTFNTGRATLATFFEWCRQRGHMPRNSDPLVGTTPQRVTPRDRIIIPQTEWDTFLTGVRSERARVTCALGLYLFVRKSETEVLRWQDINMDTKTVDVWRPKTRTLDVLPICEELEHELQMWRLSYSARVGQTPLPGWYVVPGISNPGIGRSTPGVKGFTSHGDPTLDPTRKANLNFTLRRALTDAGYYKAHEGGHTLRRSGAIALYNQLSSVGHDRAIRICQAMLGHASVQTTEIYLRLDLDRKVRNDLLAGRRMFPAQQEADVIQLLEKVGESGQANA